MEDILNLTTGKNYFGTNSQFNTTIYDENSNPDFHNTYQNYGIVKGLTPDRKSIGVQAGWIRKNNIDRTKQGLSDLNNTFKSTYDTNDTSINNVINAQKQINQLLKQISVNTGQDFGAINVDGKWGDQTQLALNYIKNYSDPKHMDEFRTQHFDKLIPPPILNKKQPIYTPLKQVNRSIVRMGLNDGQYKRKDGSVIQGINNTDELRYALLNPNETKDNYFINDLRKVLLDKGMDINNNDQWQTFLNDARIRGGIGAKDRKDLRMWYNNIMAVKKHQQGGQLDSTDDGQIQILQQVGDMLLGENAPDASTQEGQQQIMNAVKYQYLVDNGVSDPTEQDIDSVNDDDVSQYFQTTLLPQLQNQSQDVTMAKFGSKLNYINYLKGVVPEGYEPVYLKCGGRMVRQMRKQKGGTMVKKPTNNKKELSSVISEFKNNSKTNKQNVRKHLIGGSIFYYPNN